MEGNGDRIWKPGGRRGNSYFLKSSTRVCSRLNITECLKSVSPRGKMIPAELEKQIWQASKEVRGEKERGRKQRHLSGYEGGFASSQTRFCVWEREGSLLELK